VFECGVLCLSDGSFYFFGRLGTAGGARPVDTPGREGIDGGGRGTPPERDIGLLGTMGVCTGLARCDCESKERIAPKGSKSSNY